MKFHPILKRAIKRGFKKGLLTEEQRDQAWKAIDLRSKNGKKVCDEIRKKMEEEVRKDSSVCLSYENVNGVESIDWSELWNWIKNNLPTIMKIILSIVVMFI